MTELDPYPTLAPGLCDLGQGYPELGSVSLAELEALRGPGGLTVERPLFFKPTRTLKAYVRRRPIIQFTLISKLSKSLSVRTGSDDRTGLRR